jgi:hypothetical protein
MSSQLDMFPGVPEPNDEEIRALALGLHSLFGYIERYPRPSVVAARIDQIRQHVENLAIKAHAKET